MKIGQITTRHGDKRVVSMIVVTPEPGDRGETGRLIGKAMMFCIFFFRRNKKLVICNCSKKIFTIGQTAMKRHCGAMYRFCSTQRYIHGREVARDRRCDGMVVTGDGEGCIYVCNFCNI